MATHAALIIMPLMPISSMCELNRWKYTPSNIEHIPMVMVTLSILIIVLSFTPNLYVIQDMCKS